MYKTRERENGTKALKRPIFGLFIWCPNTTTVYRPASKGRRRHWCRAAEAYCLHGTHVALILSSAAIASANNPQNQIIEQEAGFFPLFFLKGPNHLLSLIIDLV